MPFKRYAPDAHSDVYRFSIPAFLLTLATGLFAGSTVDAWLTHPAPPMRLMQSNTGATMPVVRVDGIVDGSLRGTALGGVRLFAAGKPVAIDGSGAFAVSDATVLTNIITVRVPPGMRFVASSKGKKYYAVDSAGGKNIVPHNRVYFPTEAAAQRAGYVR